MDVSPGLPACSGAEPLADGWIAYRAQKGPYSDPEVAQVGQLDGPGLWHPDGVDLGWPVWSPSGQYVVWSDAVPYGPPEEYRANRRPVAYTADGQPVQEDVLVAYEPSFWAEWGFAPPGSLPGGDDWYLARVPDRVLGDAAVAVPLPSGEPMRIPAELGEGDSWAWFDDGRLAILRLLRDGGDSQYLEVRPALGSDPSITMTLTGGTRDPGLRLHSWSTGGERLVATECGHVLSNSTCSYPDVVLVEITGGSVISTNLSWQAYPALLGWATDRFDWSPQDSRLLAAAVTSVDGHGDGPNRVVVLDSVSGEIQFSTDTSMLATAPKWSPDGTLIAFVGVSPPPGLPGRYPWDYEPVWAEGEDRRPFRRGLAIHVADPATGEVRQVTAPGEAWDTKPEWTGDGKHLLYMRGFDSDVDARDTRYQVRVASLEDGIHTVLLDHVAPDWAYQPSVTSP